MPILNPFSALTAWGLAQLGGAPPARAVLPLKALPAPAPGGPAPQTSQILNVTPGQPALPSIDIPSLQRTYQMNTLAYACIQIRASCATTARVVVEAKRGDQWAPVAGHPCAALLARPRPRQTGASFVKQILMDLDITGRFYAEIVRTRYGAPAALYRIDPARVRPVPAADGRAIERYRVQQPWGAWLDLPAENVLSRLLPHPTSEWDGLAPLAVALGMVDADNAQTEYVRAFFNNGAIPAGILNVLSPISERQAHEIRDRWTGTFGRLFGRQHSVAVLEKAKMEYQPTGARLDQLDSALLRSIGESRICMTFQVPPLIVYSYLGLERATYNNLPAAYRGFWDSTMVPWFEECAAWLQSELLSEFEPDARIAAEQIRCRFDLSQVTALQDNADAKESRLLNRMKEGTATLNETRAGLSLPPDPAGDYYTRQVRVVATKFGTDVADIPAGAGTTGTGDASGQAADALQAAMEEATAKLTAAARAGKDGG